MPRGGCMVRNARHSARALQKKPEGIMFPFATAPPWPMRRHRESFWTINGTMAGGAYVDIAGNTGLDEGIA